MHSEPSQTKHYPAVAIALVLFWLLLSGHYTPLLLTLGAGAVGLVMWLLRRMDRVDGQHVALVPGWRLLRYLLWLARIVVESNIDVARRIWAPDMPIKPSWARLKYELDAPMQTTLYANSITLTPGTLTADIGENEFLVHTLTEEGISDLRDGEMERRVRGSGI